MKTTRTLFILSLVLFGVLTVYGQVSIDSTTSFTDAMKAFEKLNEKIIVDPYKFPTPIGITIINKPWREAFEMILRANGLWYDDQPNYVLLTRGESAPVSRPTGGSSDEKKDTKIISSLSRDVKISAIIYRLNTAKSMSLGIDWSVPFKFTSQLAGLNDSAAISFGTTPPPTPATLTTASKGELGAAYLGHFDFGNVSAFARFLAANDLGELIASPQLTVHTSETGTSDIGDNIPYTKSVTQTAGVVTTSVEYLQTGIIFKVIPTVINEDKFSFISLDVEVTNSTPLTTSGGGTAPPPVSNTRTTTKLLLADGEETIISGLHQNLETKARAGIPVLKDLPWWFLGLRYIFGFENSTVVRSEIAILIKAEILPTVRERARQKAADNAIDHERVRFQNDLERLKTKEKE